MKNKPLGPILSAAEARRVARNDPTRSELYVRAGEDPRLPPPWRALSMEFEDGVVMYVNDRVTRWKMRRLASSPIELL